MTKPPFEDAFARLDTAAHAGAFGFGKTPPTPSQCAAGNYKVGRFAWNGMVLAIEQPRGSYRTKTSSQGRTWSNLMAAHYGYIAGTKGADGDAVDCFIGGSVLSEVVFVINQGFDGKFDEHKVMLCFDDENSARNAYLCSYERGWPGLTSIVTCSLAQFKWWLKHGSQDKELNAKNLPFEGNTMKSTQWTSEALPIDTTLDTLLYQIRADDGHNGLLLDSATIHDFMQDPDNEALLQMDAMVTPFHKLQSSMDRMRAVMDRVNSLKALSVQVTDPFKQKGTVNVAAVFELSDGQTISVVLHNPDATPSKIDPQDELVSWKWMLNKKDVTIAVAPERGLELSTREVARRLMRLAEKNSAAFQRANSKRTERMQAIQGLESEVGQLESELARKQRELEVAMVEAEEREQAKKNAAPIKPEPPVAQEPVPPQEPEQEPAQETAPALPHQSTQILDALRTEQGWEKVIGQADDSVRKYFPGVRAPGEAVPDGGRWFYATYTKDAERRRYISVMLADNELFDLDGRDQNPSELAKELSDRAEEKAQAMRDKLNPSTSKLDQAKELVKAVATELQKLGWVIEPVRLGYSAKNMLSGNELTIEPDDANPGAIDVSGSQVYIVLGDDPAKTAQKMDLDDFRAGIDGSHEGDVIDDEDSEFFGKRVEFAYANEVLELAAQKHGCVIVWGDFNASLTSGSLFDSATHFGVSAQIGKDGQVIARAEISEMGAVTLYRGAAGDQVALKESENRTQVEDAIKQLVEAMPAPMPEPAPLPEPEPEPAVEDPSATAPADNDVTRMYALKKLVPKGSILSDDPDATAKLTAKLNFLDAESAMMKKANRLVRAGKRDELVAMGFSSKVADALFEKDFAGRSGFADFHMTNNRSEARRVRLRLDAIEQDRIKEQTTVPATEQEQNEPVQDPVLADPAPATTANDGRLADLATLKAIIEGQVDALTMDLDALEAIFDRHPGDQEINDLFEQAVDVVSDAEVKATETV